MMETLILLLHLLSGLIEITAISVGIKVFFVDNDKQIGRICIRFEC